MKNKEYKITIILIVFIIVLVIINFFRFGFINLNRRLFDNEWYHYNFATGYYEKIKFSDNKIEFMVPNDINKETGLESCTEYTYNKKTREIHLNCGKTIKVEDVNWKSIEMIIDDRDLVFFDNEGDSLNYEFKSYFTKSVVDFKEEKSQVLEYSKINEEKLLEVIKDKEYSKILFMGDKCSSINCVLVLDIMEKWVSTTQNIYFYDPSELNQNVIDYINNNNSVKVNIDDFNDTYPRVLVVKNNKIIENYNIKCTGFNCNTYLNNEF